MLVEKLVLGPLETNCYIVSKNGKALIIDPAYEYKRIRNFIETKELNVVGILITHYHFDHIGALKRCKQEYNCQIIDYKKEGIQEIDDFTFEIIKTPGHSTDSVTYYFDQKIMFVGDFIFKGCIGRTDLSGGNDSEMIKSIKKIKTYPKNITLYPGHGDETTLEDEINTNIYLIKETTNVS